MFMVVRVIHTVNVGMDFVDQPLLQAMLYVLPVIGYGLLLGSTQVIESKFQHINGFMMQMSLIGLEL